jgi:anaphase-promoting complex subunit 3
LAQAWRKLGENAKADEEYLIAQHLKQQATDVSRNELQDYLVRSVKDTNGTGPDVSVPSLAQPTSPGLADLNRKRQLLQDFVAQIRFDLSVFYIHEQRPQDAAVALADLFQERPDYPGLNKTYGTALFLAGKYAEAAPLLRQSLDRSPDDLDMRRMLAQAYFRTEDYRNTVAVLRGHPWHDIPTQYALATALARAGQDDAAREAFATLLEEHSASAELQALLGQAAAQQRDYSSAITYYRKALALDHSIPEAHLGIALIEMRNGQLQASETELRAELSAHPKDFRAKYYLAYVLGLSQKHIAAERLLRVILSKRPDFPEAHATLGTELLAQNRPSDALEELLIADKLSPSQAKLHYQLGIVYRKLGRAQEAEQAFARYRELKQHSGGDALSIQPEDGHE